MVTMRCTIFLLFLGIVSVRSLSHSKPRRVFLKTAFAVGSFAARADAYERRDVGDESRSAATAAMNDQAYRTNSRLEASGFKLDTREEEQVRPANQGGLVWVVTDTFCLL